MPLPIRYRSNERESSCNLQLATCNVCIPSNKLNRIRPCPAIHTCIDRYSTNISNSVWYVYINTHSPITMANCSTWFLLSLFSFHVLATVSPNPIRTTTMTMSKRVLDITHPYRVGVMPVCPFTDGLGQFLWLKESIANGSEANVSELRMSVHTGTHVDAPGHMYQAYFEAGYDVDSLDLQLLNGPALLIDVPRDKNITAEVMESLNIPRGVQRVAFRTLNTDRKLMLKKECDTSFVGFTKDGAQWLVDNTDIKLVGVDYLSVAAFDDLIPAHLVFLKNPEMIIVEALKLDAVDPGIYSLHCLPLRLVGSDGSPIRCILIQ